MIEEEHGITQISLRNLEKLVADHGKVRLVIHFALDDPIGHYTMIYFQDGYRHKANGFASGYGGEGPHGLLTALHKYLGRYDISIQDICGWRLKAYLIIPASSDLKEKEEVVTKRDPLPIIRFPFIHKVWYEDVCSSENTEMEIW